jgi:hypothetical protein
MRNRICALALVANLAGCATPEPSPEVLRLKDMISDFVDATVDGCVVSTIESKRFGDQLGAMGQFRIDDNPEARQAAGLPEGDVVWVSVKAGHAVSVLDGEHGCTVSAEAVPPAETVAMVLAILQGVHGFSEPVFTSSKEAQAVVTQQIKAVRDRELHVVTVGIPTAEPSLARVTATVSWKD